MRRHPRMHGTAHHEQKPRALNLFSPVTTELDMSWIRFMVTQTQAFLRAQPLISGLWGSSHTNFCSVSTLTERSRACDLHSCHASVFTSIGSPSVDAGGTTCAVCRLCTRGVPVGFGVVTGPRVPHLRFAPNEDAVTTVVVDASWAGSILRESLV